MENVKICAQCGAPYVDARCPNCGGVAENGTSGRILSAPTPAAGVLDVPKCPWCGAVMAVELWQNLEGKWISYCHCVVCKAKAPSVMADINHEDLIEAAKMMVNCRFVNTGNRITNGDRLRRIGRLPDKGLAELLWKVVYEGLDEKIPFCKNDPECDELACEGGVPEEKCKQCLIQWLGEPAEEQEGGSDARD